MGYEPLCENVLNFIKITCDTALRLAFSNDRIFVICDELKSFLLSFFAYEKSSLFWTNTYFDSFEADISFFATHPENIRELLVF